MSFSTTLLSLFKPKRKENNVLILTRRIGETINIGDDVEVTVLSIKGQQVRIGVNAPRTIAVHRSEVYDRIQREQATEKQPA